MIAIISYIDPSRRRHSVEHISVERTLLSDETIRHYDRELHDVLDSAFRINDHYYIGRDLEDIAWCKKQRGKAHCFTNLLMALTFMDSKYELVNVQRKKTFEKAGQDWQTLEDFVHGKDCCYVFGPNFGEPSLAAPATNISIDIGRGSLHTITAAAMVLYDREMKCRASDSV